MGPYGSVGAHIKTGKSPMAYDHFWTPPDPKMGHKNPKMIKKSKIPPKMHFLALAAIHPGWGNRYGMDQFQTKCKDFHTTKKRSAARWPY